MSNYSERIRNMETLHDNWVYEQEKALFPREVLESLYGEYMAKYATSPNPSAYEFFIFLLRQCKSEHYEQSK